jgi:hypothetical protein
MHKTAHEVEVDCLVGPHSGHGAVSVCTVSASHAAKWDEHRFYRHPPQNIDTIYFGVYDFSLRSRIIVHTWVRLLHIESLTSHYHIALKK